MERNKIIIISVSVIVGLSVVGGLCWLIYWLVTKDGAAAAKALMEDKECDDFGKVLYAFAADANKKVAKTDLEAWSKDLVKDMPIKDFKMEVKEDIAAEDKMVEFMKANRVYAFLLRDAHTAFTEIDADKSKSLTSAELAAYAVGADGDVLVDVADTNSTGDVSFTEFVALMAKGYFKNARNFMWTAGGDDHKLSADDYMAVMFFDDKAKVEAAAGTDKVFSLGEFLKFVAAKMTASGVALDKTTFDTADAWNAWILDGVVAKCEDGGKWTVAKLKDSGIEIPEDAAAQGNAAAFKTKHGKLILEKMKVANPGATTA